jgi:hypothetical protein
MFPLSFLLSASGDPRHCLAKLFAVSKAAQDNRLQTLCKEVFVGGNEVHAP